MEHLLIYFTVEDFLNPKFSKKWFGRGRLILSHLVSPHLTPFDFF
jgi:hypothetical protein